MDTIIKKHIIMLRLEQKTINIKIEKNKINEKIHLKTLKQIIQK